MSPSPDFEAVTDPATTRPPRAPREAAAPRRIKLSRAETDAAAARHLAAAHDRDLSDLGVKVEANRRAINALGEQTRARFDEVDRRFDRLEAEVRAGFDQTNQNFTAVRGLLDMTAAAQQRTAELLDVLIAERGDRER